MFFIFLAALILFYIFAFRVKWREIFGLFLVPLAKRIPLYISPNHITVLSFLFALTAGVFIYFAKYDDLFFLWAALFLLLFTLADTLDGFLARIRDQLTKCGSFLDYTLDKLSYLALLFAAMLGGHIRIELIVITMLLSLFYNLIDMESLALSGSESSLTEHSRWLIPAIILCLLGAFGRFLKFKLLFAGGIKLQVLDIFFLILPICIALIILYKIISLWKDLGVLDQAQNRGRE